MNYENWTLAKLKAEMKKIEPKYLELKHRIDKIEASKPDDIISKYTPWGATTNTYTGPFSLNMKDWG